MDLLGWRKEDLNVFLQPFDTWHTSEKFQHFCVMVQNLSLLNDNVERWKFQPYLISTTSRQVDQAGEGPAQNCSPGRSTARCSRECCGAEEEVRWPEALQLQQSRAESCYPGSPEDGVMWCEKRSASGRAVASVMWLAVVRVWWECDWAAG